MNKLSRKILSSFVSLALVAGLLPAASWADEETAPQEEAAPTTAVNLDAPHKEGVILVSFKDGVSLAEAEDALQPLSDPDEALSALAEDDLEEGWPVCVDIDPSLSVAQAIELAQQNENVAYAQPDYLYEFTPIVYESEPFEMDSDEEEEGVAEEDTNDESLEPLATTTNDPALKSFVPSTGTANAWQLKRMNVLNAWDKVRANNAVTVAVLDSGCRTTHEDLKDRILTSYMYDFVANSQSMTDLRGHGTEVCGMLAATANNSKGTAGTSYNARILPLRIGGTSASDNTLDTGLAVKAYKYLIDLAKSHSELGLHVVNLSWGHYGTEDPALQRAIDVALSHEIISIAAGGNGDDNNDPITSFHAPSDLPNVVAVTALDTADKTSSGTYGTMPTIWSDYNANKDLIAPGNGLYTTSNDGNSKYVTSAGTSLASPLVAGVFSLLWAANPHLSATQARTAVESTVYTDFTPASGRPKAQYGKGIPNALAAVNAALAASDNNKESYAYFGYDNFRLSPWASGYRYSTSQIIYPASEIGRAGTISDLYYNINESAANYTGSLQIYLGHTTKNGYSTTSEFIPVSQQTKCYDKASRTTNSSVGWEQFMLGTKFYYNGKDNLVVTVVRGLNSSSLGDYAVAGTITTNNIGLVRYSNTNSNYANPTNNKMDYLYKNAPALKLGFTTVANLTPIAKPTAKNFTFNGTQQFAVPTSSYYTISGTYGATSAGTYTCTVAPNSKYMWDDGTTTPITLTWTISPKKVTAPWGKFLTINGALQVGVDSGDDYVLSGTYRATMPGDYTACASLPNTRDYQWDDGTTAPKDIPWSITTPTGLVPWSCTGSISTGYQESATRLPLVSTNLYGTTQMLFTPAELCCAGEITSVSLYLTASSRESLSLTDLRIYMCNTSLDKINSTQQLDTNNVTLVYRGTPTVPAQGNQKFTLDLNTAFSYNGTDNLGIIITHKASATATSVYFACTSMADMCVWRSSSTDENSGYLYGTAAYSAIGNRPDMEFEMSTGYTVIGNYTKTTSALVMYGAAPTSGSLTYNGEPMAYDKNKHAWIFPSSDYDLLPMYVSPSTNAPQIITLQGDVNRNGAINIVDAQLAYDVALGKLELTESTIVNYAAADADLDNFVDALDAFAIQHRVLTGTWG